MFLNILNCKWAEFSNWKARNGVSKVAYQVKASTAKVDYLTSNPSIHIVEGQSQLS